MSAVTLAEAKHHLRIGSTTVVDDYIQLLLDGCEEWIQTYCGISFSSTTQTDERVDGGSKYLDLAVKPVTAITSVKDTEDSDAVLAATEYVLRRRGPVMKDYSHWEYGMQRWKVTYTGGYTSNTLPKGLKFVILQLMYRAYHNKGAQQAEQSANVWIQWDTLAGNDVMQLMNIYRMGPLV